MKSYKIGNRFRVRYTLRNGGDLPFPGGTFDVNILWPSGQFERTTYRIPGIDPGRETDAEPVSEWGVLSKGYALFNLTQPIDNNGNRFGLHRREGALVTHEPVSFHSVLGIDRSCPNLDCGM